MTVIISNIFSIGRIQNNTYIPLGTSTLINEQGLLVTAAHVVKGNDTNLCIKLNDPSIYGYQDATIKTVQTHRIKIVAINPIHDLCVLYSPELQGYPVSIKISDSDSINILEEIIVSGFPHSDMGRLVLTQQLCEVGAKILLSSNGIKSKHLVLNIQSRPGQSGGPIFGRKNGSLIAILIGAFAPTQQGMISISGINPATLHQTTHAVSAGYLKEMIDSVYI